MNTKITQAITRWVMAFIILSVGVLCVVTNTTSGESQTIAIKTMSMIIGITFVILATLAIGAELLIKKAITSTQGIAASMLLALGIFFICEYYAPVEIIFIFVEFIPYALLAIGSLIVLDALILLVMAKKQGVSDANIVLVVEAIIGIISIVFGALALSVPAIRDNKFTIFGVILILDAIWTFLQGVVIIKYGKDLRRSFKKDSINAEFHDINNDEPKEEANTENQENAE